MAAKGAVKRLTAALGELQTATDPLTRLDIVRRIREAADELEAGQVEAARSSGITWSEIGTAYGLTKQGAQQRFRQGR